MRVTVVITLVALVLVFLLTETAFACGRSNERIRQRPSRDGTNCPESFTLHDGFCYYFTTHPEYELTWMQAQEQCIRMNDRATLTRPYTANDETYIQGEMAAIAEREGGPSRYWLDLMDGLYSNGDVPVYTNWNPDQLGYDTRHMDCVLYYPYTDDTSVVDITGPQKDWRWTKGYCSSLNRYICQMPAF